MVSKFKHQMSCFAVHRLWLALTTCREASG